MDQYVIPKMPLTVDCLAADRQCVKALFNADGSVSVRLGRVSLVQASMSASSCSELTLEMSTNWWEVWGSIVFVPTSAHLLRNFTDVSWRETQAVTELTHVGRP